MKFRDWHTVTTGSACWKEMLSICCAWTRTYTCFSQYTWTWQFLSTSAPSRSLPCCHANKVWQKASLGSAFTISSPGRGLSTLPWLHKLSELSQQDHFLSAEVHDLHGLKKPSASYSSTISHLPARHLHPITQADRKNPNHWITDWRAQTCIT